MPLQRYRDDSPAAVRVYTVCDESKYLIVRNVPALGCGDQLENLFGSYGDIEEWHNWGYEISNARFAKRKLDESVFFGNRLQVSYAPQFETLADTKEKLEGRRKEVLGRIKHSRPEGSKGLSPAATHLLRTDASSHFEQAASMSSNHELQNFKNREYMLSDQSSDIKDPRIRHVSSDKEYFASSSMNKTVRLVRDKLDKIKSSSDIGHAASAPKRTRLDNRRRI